VSVVVDTVQSHISGVQTAHISGPTNALVIDSVQEETSTPGSGNIVYMLYAISIWKTGLECYLSSFYVRCAIYYIQVTLMVIQGIMVMNLLEFTHFFIPEELRLRR